MARILQLLEVLLLLATVACLPLMRQHTGTNIRTRRHLFAKEGLSSSSANGDGPPFWAKRKKPDKLVVAEPTGSTVEFRCPAEGRPSPEITWLKDNRPFTKRKLGKIEQRRWLLRLTDVIVDDDGNYTCIISNQYGEIRWTYVLDVVPVPPRNPPVINIKPQNKTITVGDNLTMECRVLLDLEPPINWYKHVNVVDNSSDNISERVIVLQQSGMNVTRPQIYTITNASYDDAGKYTCYVMNEYGQDMASAFISVVPPEPEAIRTIEVQVHHTSIIQILIPVALGVGLLLITICLVLVTCKHRLHKRHASPRIIMQDNFFYSGVSEKLNIMFDAKWEFPRERLELGQTLGEGAFGKVVKALATGGICSYNDSVTVAVKMLKEDATECEVRNLLDEMQVMKTIGHHKNIVNLLGTCTQDGPLYMIVEYASNGNLRDYLKKHRAPDYGYEQPHRDVKPLPTPPGHLGVNPLTQKNLLSFAYQIARGMEYLSSKKILHRDLAARNVLVYDDLVLKIADFGLTRKVAEQDYYRKTTNGRVPVKWMAPEALFDHKYSCKSDVWSYGVLLWEIYTLGGNPLASVPMENLLELLRAGYRMEKPPYASFEIYSIMLKCWQQNPKDRLNFPELVKQFDKLLTDSSETQDYLMLGSTLRNSDDQLPAGMRTPRPSDSQYSSGGSMCKSSTSPSVTSSVMSPQELMSQQELMTLPQEPSPLLAKEDTDCELSSDDDNDDGISMNNQISETQALKKQRRRSETCV